MYKNPITAISSVGTPYVPNYSTFGTHFSVYGVGGGLAVILGVTVGVCVKVGVGEGVTQEKVFVISQDEASIIFIIINGLLLKILGIGTLTGADITADNERTQVIWFMSQTYMS